MRAVEQVAQVGRPRGQSAYADEAFADLLRPLIEPGFRLALAMLHDPNAAEDVVQEASVVAWRKAARIREPQRLRSWFFGVVANTCRNARRRRWFTSVEIGLPEVVTIPSGEDRAVSGADLRRAVAGLRHEDRLVVVLYFYLDLPLEEIARITRNSVAATRARLYRSIQRLRPGLEVEEALR